MSRGRLAALAETVMALALVAWVGGTIALGAYTARIVFRELPRELAAPTMNLIFRSFDGLAAGCILLFALGLALRLYALGLPGRAERIFAVASICLIGLGVLDLGYVHPSIERLFREGRTLEPAFLTLHRLSTRSANLEVLCAILVLGGLAFARRRAPTDSPS